MAVGSILASTLTDVTRLIAGVVMALKLPYALFGIPADVLVHRGELR
ncbi:hypothetical protein [Streptomyces sp. NPDC005336]